MGFLERLRKRAQRSMIERLADAAHHDGRDDVATQINHALDQNEATLPWVSIITALLPFITQLLGGIGGAGGSGGGSLDWGAVLTAILGLFKQHGLQPV